MWDLKGNRNDLLSRKSGYQCYQKQRKQNKLYNRTGYQIAYHYSLGALIHIRYFFA